MEGLSDRRRDITTAPARCQATLIELHQQIKDQAAKRTGTNPANDKGAPLANRVIADVSASWCSLNKKLEGKARKLESGKRHGPRHHTCRAQADREAAGLRRGRAASRSQRRGYVQRSPLASIDSLQSRGARQQCILKKPYSSAWPDICAPAGCSRALGRSAALRSHPCTTFRRPRVRTLRASPV